MPRNLNSSLTTIGSRYFTHFITGSLFITALIIFSSCKDNEQKKIDTISQNNTGTSEISSDSLRILLSDSTKVNWLDGHGWDTIAIDAHPEDREKIQNEMEKIRYYVQGALSEYNIAFTLHDDSIPYKIKEFRYAVKSTNPFRFTVIAYLTPQAERLPQHEHENRPLGHLKPPEPPPPPK